MLSCFSLIDNEVDDVFYKRQEAMHSKISDLSILLFDKLEFLEVSRKGLTNFQVLLIEMEVRHIFHLSILKLEVFCVFSAMFV